MEFSIEVLKDKNLLIGVCGSFGAVSLPPYLALLKNLFQSVNIIPTYSALNIVHKNSLRYFADNIYENELFSEKNHIQIARENDIFIIFPATANIISTAAHGLANSLLSTTILCYPGKVLFFPNMNLDMWKSPILQRNVKELRNFHFVYEPTKKIAYEICSKSYKENIVIPDLEIIVECIFSELINKSK